jgi:D-psicose/D-tagatose/L-ribulose 3-epimerase
MKYGVNLLIWTANFDKSHLSLLTRISAAGFDGVEVPMYKGRDFAVPALRRGLADTGMDCTICSVLVDGLSLISEDDGIRARAVEQLRENIAVTAEVGAKIIAGPL